MTPSRTLLALSLFLSAGLALTTSLRAQMTDLPQLVLEPGGSTSYITSMAFSPRGEQLFVAGFDKVVRVWRRDPATGNYLYDPQSSLRVPMGHGVRGAVNTIALSDDGRFLAVGGRGLARGEAEPSGPARLVGVEAASDEMLEDIGTIHVFDLVQGGVRSLRGHRGEVIQLDFAPGIGNPTLVSVGTELATTESGSWSGAIRLWQLAESDVTAGRKLPLEHERRPAQVGLGTQRDAAGLTIMFQLGNSQQQIWPTARETVLAISRPEHRYDDTLAMSRGAEGIAVSGSRIRSEGKTQGVLEWWKPGRGHFVRTQTSPLDTGAGFFAVPRSVALVASAGAGQDVAAAAVLRLPHRRNAQPAVYQLLLVKRDTNASVTVPLWTAGATMYRPTVVASPDGRTLAVAGSGGHDVRVFDVAELLAGQTRFQRLRGLGSSVRRVAFAARGESTGLIIETVRGSQAGPQMVFDFANNRLSESDGAWQRHTAARVPHSIRAEGRALLLDDGRGNIHTIEAAPRQQFTAAVTGVAQGQPIAAIASVTGGISTIEIYDAARGSLVRTCTAHTMPAEQLTFSPDGRFLLSLGADQIIYVWSLVDLDCTLATKGVPPVIVRDKDGLVYVEALRTAGDELREGDKLEAVLANGAWQPLRVAGELYQRFWQQQPGSSLQLRRNRAGQTQEVSVEVIPFIDEKPPLFSLYLLNPGRLGPQATWQWIGWTPVGPYDASSEQVERFIGWHFNTGRPESPTLFAPAGEYREQFQRKGLLGDLMRRGKLAAVAPAPPPQRPEMQLSLDRREGTDELIVLDKEPLDLNLTILETKGIESIQFLLDGEDHGTFQHETAGLWRAELSDVRWAPGKTRELSARVELEGGHLFEAMIRAEYRRPPPIVTLKSEPDQILLAEKFQLQFDVAPAVSGSNVEYRITREHDGRSSAVEQGRAAELKSVVVDTNLEVGTHRFRVDAFYVGRDPQEQISTRHLLIKRAAEEQPLIRIQPDFVTSQGPQGSSESEEITPGTAVRIKKKRIGVSGSISARERITEGRWQLGELSGPLKIGPFTPGKPQTFEIPEIAAEKGKQALKIEGRTASNQQATTELQIDFRPPLPQVTILTPQNGADYLDDEVEIVAEMDKTERYLVESTEMIVNGELVASQVDDGVILGRAKLRHGNNTIEVAVANQYQSQPRRTVISVRHLQPPRITQLSEPQVGETPLVTLVAKVESKLPLTRIELNEAATLAHEIERGEGDEWQVTIREVPLSNGRNELTLACWNRDGQSQRASTLAIYEAAPPPQPIVQFLNPRSDTTSPKKRFRIDYWVESESRIQKVILVQNDRLLLPSQQLQAVADETTLVESVFVDLEPGNNHFRLVAINEGGRSETEVNVSLPQVPATILVDHLVSTRSSRKIFPRRSTSSVLEFRKMDYPTIRVHGRIVLNQSLTPQKISVLHAWVNGFQQKPVRLGAATDGEIAFEIPLVLNSKQNRIEVRLPNLATNAQSNLHLEVPCSRPDDTFGIHVLVVGVGVEKPDEAALTQRALEALRATPQGKQGEAFTSGAFRAGVVYGPVTGQRIQRGRVLQELLKIRQAIQAGTVRNNVVMIYYQGGEIIYDANHFFLTTYAAAEREVWTKRRLQRDAIDSKLLEQFINDAHGAHVLFLDVARGPQTATSTLQDESQAGLIRFAWIKNDPSQGARLLLALKGALQPPKTLGDVAELLSESFETEEDRLISRTEQSLTFEGFVPESLQALQLTGGE